MNLRDRDATASRAHSIEPILDITGQGSSEELEDEDDDDPSLLPGETYDTLICGHCALSIPTVRRWAGTPGVIAVVRDSQEGEWHVTSETSSDDETQPDVTESSSAGVKRSLHDPLENEQPTKRARTTPSDAALACLAPPINAAMSQVYISLENATTPEASFGAGDVFLTEGWRDRWCKCDEVLQLAPIRFKVT